MSKSVTEFNKGMATLVQDLETRRDELVAELKEVKILLAKHKKSSISGKTNGPKSQ